MNCQLSNVGLNLKTKGKHSKLKYYYYKEMCWSLINMNAVKVLLRNRTACAVGNRFYATAKKKIPDPDEEESLPSKYYYNLQRKMRHV